VVEKKMKWRGARCRPPPPFLWKTFTGNLLSGYLLHL